MKRACLKIFCVFVFFSAIVRGKDSIAVVLFAGDLNFSAHFENSFKNDIPNIFEKWNNVGHYDLMMVNLENAITTSDDAVQKEFVFKMKPELLPLLTRARISVVNCANNHTADFRIKGIIETIKYLEGSNINYVGIGRNLEEARRPVIKNINGITIGFLGYAEIGTYIAKKDHPGRAPLRADFIEDIKKLREQVDYIVVNLHWGKELAKYPLESQIKVAHKIVNAGADLIIGHHPHVLQGIEKYKNKVIVYSLGNFIFGGNKKAENSETAIIKAKYSKLGMSIEVVPVTIRNWRPEPADEQTKKKIMAIIKERSEIFKENSIFYIDDKSKIN